MTEINARINRCGVIPVINIKKTEWALPLAEILLEAGFPALEITLRSDAALESMRLIHEKYPEMILSAGTVFYPEQAEAAMAAGANFLVTPGYEANLAAYCKEKGYALVPGCASPSEIQTAYVNGISVQKFFPAELSGGVAALKLFSGAFRDVKFVPTGGISLSNLGSYLKEACVLACGGSFMAPAGLLEAGDWDGIRALCKQVASIAKEAGRM
ncbi:MAG: bifunctional 4-hydroxy-2-oxoglutarate aldolase/2-dehydro-3-deoxy-phosphogluconate aldolase [Ruminococcaceae bacterium]|nr:bifunctional 4-hydroxy-2-oxoglutarate aldolase/2-dehydro-3-deoxy-phosphogluconate aldolase [Oscillospiraceae bacterium]